jgi:hypothetical protein
VDREVTKPSEVHVSELYRNDYTISNCDTADGSNCEILNCVTVRENVQ